MMKHATTKSQPPENLDDDLLRAVAKLLKRTPWQVHWAEVAFAMGAITHDDCIRVYAAARAGKLDDLESEIGRRAWAILGRWLPNDEVQN